MAYGWNSAGTVDVPWLGADAYATVTDLVSFFIENNDALIYVIGGRFFDRNELLLPDD